MYKLITIFMLTLTILTISCKKDVEKIETVKNKQPAITQRLIDFKQSLMLKNDASYSCDSALWYLEGILNLENANNIHSFDEVNFYHDTLNFVVSNDSIQSAQFSVVYNAISVWLNSIIANSNANVNFDVIDISLIENGYKSTNKQLVVSTSAGELATTPIMNYVPFGSTDYWNWGWGEGRCGDYTGQDIGRDATTELQRKFNHPLSQTTIGYFVSVEEQIAIPFYYEESNPFGSYMMFNAGGTGSDPYPGPCVSPDELNYYLSKFDYIKNDLCPNGKEFKSVEVKTSFSVGIGYWNYIHQYNLYYGIKVPKAIID